MADRHPLRRGRPGQREGLGTLRGDNGGNSVTPVRITPILVYGRGGHASVVVDALHLMGLSPAAFIDDTSPRAGGETHRGAPVFSSWHGAVEQFGRHSSIALAIGPNRPRLERARMITQAGISLTTVIHPSAIVSPSAVIGAGTYLGPQAIVNANARVGVACIINSGACVEHDCQLDDGVHVAPGAVLCGWCSIGECTMIGAGASIIDRIRVDAEAVIGAGAAVVRPVEFATIVAGCPARELATS